MFTHVLVLLLGIFLPTVVLAHSGFVTGGFVAGLNHPILGVDHLLAMISVGIISAQKGGRAIWEVPATFVIVMIIGGVLGMQGIRLFSVELSIAISILVLGILIAANKNIPTFIAIIFVAFFAIFHGHAHGSEMFVLTQPFHYLLGFIIGTLCIHVLGVLIGILSKSIPHGQQLLRYVGAGIAGIGFSFIFF